MEDILKKLVALPTVSGNRVAMHELLDYVAEFVGSRGMHVQWYAFNGFESIVATVKPGNKSPKVMLMAHGDVVSADASMFDLRKDNGRYYGRGVYDMKFAIAVYLQIIDELQADLSNYDLGIMITMDEELGGNNGVAMLVNEGYLPEVCVLPDGGDNWQIQTGSKGLLLYEIRMQGKAAHGARPWLGDNALTRLLALLDAIAALLPKFPSQVDSTITLTQMSGGEALNQIPGTATMTLDVRAAGSDEYRRLSENIGRLCDEHNATYKVVSEGAPTNFELDDPLIAPFAKHITEVTGHEVTGFYAPAASDARFLVPYGIPCVMVYPEGGNHHGPDEWLSVEAFEQFKVITRRYLDEVAKVRA